ncbi:Rqc2 family fibronectin-binding protein [Phormidium sp. CCY1219]|uniref:Rqc2 family fibronectin-binding protein n=1 Tax=Phormidium sp. CCY1219 TaxID=2886104 RepID=UPI002D1F49DD|nr:NFACT RNA binding domain-containing protein [Phormidium sp. CCY1219]MEB3829384.1 NFACT family protein [Phormidium sp. CCY1219]
MQPVDFTTLTAAYCELRATWLPARLEQVYQRDRYRICLALRTLKQRGWLTVSWHPQAARIHIGDPPPRTPDTFTFSDQLRHQLKGLALVAISPVAAWERALDLQFAKRPGDRVLWHLYVEIMGKRSNVILANESNQIVTAAHQVSEQQSRVRPILTGQPYEPPPALTDPAPSLSESQQRWQERVALIPGKLGRQLLKSYRGLSSHWANSMIRAADLDPEQSTESLRASDWERLFQRWQEWLKTLEAWQHGDLSGLHPQRTSGGYSVIQWGGQSPPKPEDTAPSVQALLDRYYCDRLNEGEFKQLRHQLLQKLNNLLKKLRVKAQGFERRLDQSALADEYRQKADLLMAHLHQWEPGMKSMTLADFETGEPIEIELDPEKNAVQNAQGLYKQHQKLKRARSAVEPLLAQVDREIQYLEQVEVAIAQLDSYREPMDLQALEEIRDELMQEGYLRDRDRRSQNQPPATDFYRFESPSGFELLVGRNNRQNDLLSFRVATEYDLWFHTQEIAGSHVLLRLDPGAVADKADLQFAADVTGYFSRARQSDRVPVVYTEPKHVYKPKGAKPGMVIYKHERIIWGRPQQLAPKS